MAIELTTADGPTIAGIRGELEAQDRLYTPFLVAVKNITVLTTGTPTDIATITLPVWCTRYRLSRDATSFIVAETASGTLGGSTFTVYNAANGSGSAASSAFSGPSAAAATGVITSTLIANVQTAPTLYVRQTANSANAGTVSIYLLIVPLL